MGSDRPRFIGAGDHIGFHEGGRPKHNAKGPK